MSAEQQGTSGTAEETLPDGHGGVITRTAPSTSGGTYAGGVIVENDVGESQEALMAAIDATIKPFEEGDLVTGTVVKIEKDEVLLDIGYKSEGVIPARELSIRNDVDPSQVVGVGEQLEALVLQKEDKEGRLILSKKRAQYERAWGKIEEIKNADGIVTGPVIEVVKGGLIIDIGLRGFLPASLVEMRRVRDLQPYVGKELECRIIELDKNRNNVVLSRRKYLEESQAEQRQDFLTSLTKGEVRKGQVSSIVNFGAFVDLGGVDGLVHVSELSWKHVDHPSEVVEVGEEVEVEVLDVDLERERVSLSLKATQEDPWRQFARAHNVGDIIEGRVTKLVPFGAFVEVDDAIEGLVHISELADHHVERAEDEVGVHDLVSVKIIDIDLDRRRISLSRKQALAPQGSGAIPVEEGGVDMTAAASSDDAATETTEAPEAEMELEPVAGADEAATAEASAAVATGDAAAVVTEDATATDEPAAEAVTDTTAAGDAVGASDDTGGSTSDPAELAAGMARPQPEPEVELEAKADVSGEREAHATAAEAPMPDDAASDAEAPAAPQDAEPEAAAEAPAPIDQGETFDAPEGPADDSLESIVQDLKRERGQS